MELPTKDYHEYQLYVAYNDKRGGYLRIAGQNWLRFEEWWKDGRCTLIEIREQIMWMQGYHFGKYGVPAYTRDINEAETWDDYAIEHYAQYYPDHEFKKVTLS